MDTTAILNFLKNAAKNLFVWSSGAVTKTDEVKLVPAIAPIPINDVDKSYGTTEPIERPRKKTIKNTKKIVVERIKEVAQQRSLPYEN